MKVLVHNFGLFLQKLPIVALEIRLKISDIRSFMIRYIIIIFMNAKKRDIPVESLNYYFELVLLSVLRSGLVSRCMGNS